MRFESSIELAQLSPRGREVFHALVNGLADRAIDIEVFGQGISWMNNLTDDELTGVVAEVLKQGGWQAKACAALMYCKVTQVHPPLNEKEREVQRNAEEWITNFLAKPHDKEALCILCKLMGPIGVVPKSVLPLLETLIAHRDKVISSYAAVALCSVPEKASAALRVLHGLLDADNDQVKLIAAPVMAIHDYRVDAAISTLVEVLPKARVEDRCGIVRMIQTIGPRAIRTLPILEQMLQDTSLPSFFRARAATAIGSVTKGTSSHPKLLSDLLWSDDWEIMNGAAAGLEVNGGVRKEDIDRVASRLASDNSDMRRIAAIALKRFGPRAKRAIPKLIDRFRNEPDTQLCLGLTEAVAAIGEDAIMPLIEAVKQQDFRILPLIAVTLHAIGERAVVPVVEHLVRDPNEQVKTLGFVILRELGVSAAPAIPVLAEMIDETVCLETACLIAAVFSFCGKDSDIAARSLVQTLIRCDDKEFAQVANAAFRRIGPPALAELAKSLAGLTGDEKLRVERAIAACQPQMSERFKQLEQLNSDELLHYFVLAARVLKAKHEAGWVVIGKAISPVVTFKRANGVAFGTTGNSVRDNFKELAERVGTGPLTTHRPKVKGGLTHEGEALLNDATDYLRQKYGPDYLSATDD